MTAAHPLAPLGWDEDVARFARPQEADGRIVGRVVAVSRGFDAVHTTGGRLLTDRSHPSFRAAHLPPPAVGDWAAVLTDDSGAAVVDLAPRRGTVVRRDPADRVSAQVVAANVDSVFCTFGLDRPLRPRRLERTLVLVHEGGASPVIVLTKADVGKHLDAASATVAALAPGVPCEVVSALTGGGMTELHRWFEGNATVALLGESGAGKSSLVNALAGRSVQPVGDVRRADRRGRHTTTMRELFVLPAGGCLIDTPGLRAVGMWDADEGVDEAFPDVAALAEGCRFRDCGHDAEPGCAVRAAVEAAELAPDRFESYQALRREIDDVEAKVVDQQRRQGEGRRPPPRRSRRRR